MHYVPSSLLSIDTNSKTVKGQKLGFMTGILYLAPSDISGYQVCPMAKKANCVDACLYRAGRGAFNATQRARINKTEYFFADRQAFMRQVARDIVKLAKKAKKVGLIPLVRLNGTSDIKWENVPVTIDGVAYTNIMEAFPNIQFYDYTKIANRVELPKNYDLTFSYSGVIAYQKYVNIAIKNGMRIAVVFRSVASIPQSFLGLPVIGGDNSDVRHDEPKNTIVALYAKGPAKKDNSGFVVDTYPVFQLRAA